MKGRFTMNKLIGIISCLGILISVDSSFSLERSKLQQFNDLTVKQALGTVGLDNQIFTLSKVLKVKDGEEYLCSKLTYIELIFAGYEKKSLENAIDMFIDLIYKSDSKFYNPVNSDRIEGLDDQLRANISLHISELRRLRLDISKAQYFQKKSKILKMNLIKIFRDQITSVDDLYSSDSEA